MRIGFIGTGNIGGPMCRHVIRHSGADVAVFDLNPDAVQRCTDVGGIAAASVADAVKDADVVLTSLPRPQDVETVALGSEGIEGHARPGTVYFDLTTNSPAVAREVAAQLQTRGITMLDAPVSGGVAGAEERTLTVMAGGDAAALEEHRGVLETFGENIIHTGDLGTGCNRETGQQPDRVLHDGHGCRGAPARRDGRHRSRRARAGGQPLDRR